MVIIFQDLATTMIGQDQKGNRFCPNLNRRVVEDKKHVTLFYLLGRHLKLKLSPQQRQNKGPDLFFKEFGPK